ncbi:phosphotransferase [Phaeobacter sp. C3_T13_0]|uniref:phosphotransferase n=1 Tax=Phaeobacter cretensis TaxID=3342641 RepID=UPI0039BD74DE
MSLEKRRQLTGEDLHAAIDDVQARTLALWPRIASDLGLPVAGASFRRLQVNSRRQDSRSVQEVTIATGQRFVLRAVFEETNTLRQRRFFDRHEQAANKLKPVFGVSSPKLLWRDQDRPFVLMEFAHGNTAFRELALTEYGFGDRSQTIRRIGRAVAELHRVSDVGYMKFWPKPLLIKVSKRAHALRSGDLSIPKPKRFLGLCAHLHRAGQRARGQVFRGASEHGDLHLRNILMSESEVSFIDYSNHDGVFPQRDIADIWLSNCPDHLASGGRAPGFGHIAKEDWAAFAEGYGADLTTDPVFRFFFALRLFKLWSGLGHKRPDQQQKTNSVAAAAVEVFEALLGNED